MKTKWSWVSFVAGAAIAAAAVGVPWIVTATAQARETTYRECLIEHGYTGGTITDDQIDQIGEDCLP